MKEKLAEFFETDFQYVKVGLKKEKDLKHRDEIYWYARQRAFGATTLAQMCGLDYDTAEKMFYAYCEKIEEEEYNGREK